MCHHPTHILRHQGYTHSQVSITTEPASGFGATFPATRIEVRPLLPWEWVDVCDIWPTIPKSLLRVRMRTETSSCPHPGLMRLVLLQISHRYLERWSALILTGSSRALRTHHYPSWASWWSHTHSACTNNVFLSSHVICGATGPTAPTLNSTQLVVVCLD